MRNAKRVQIAFGKAVRKQRAAAGLSQEDVAAQAGIHRTYIGDVERGERNLGLVNMYRLASAMNVTLTILVSEMEELLVR